MKKLVLTALTVLSCGGVIALPLGNPSDASLLCQGVFLDKTCSDPCGSWLDAFNFRFGFYGDYVYNRHMQAKGSQGLVGSNDSIVERSQVFTNAGYLAVNFCNRFDIFATLGASNYRSDTSVIFPIDEVPSSTRFRIATSTHFSWSVGGRATVWECGCTALGIEGQYFQFRPEVTRLDLGDFASSYPNFDAVYREWQVGLGISHRIRCLVPYIGVKYSRAQFSYHPTTATVFSYRNQKHWGYAVGTTLVACDRISVTAEGRFADEKALHVNAQIRF